MRFYTSGNFYQNIPAVLQELPVDLLRSRQYPRNPEVLEQGVQQLQERRPGTVGAGGPVYFAPQRMGFTRWKTPPVPTAWGQNVTSMLSAVREQFTLQQSLRTHSVPVMDFVQAGAVLTGNRLPQPTDNLDPNLREGYVPLSPGVVPLDDMVDVEAVAQGAQDAGAAEDLQNDARISALEEIRAYQDRLQMMAMSNAGVPWFMRG